MKYWDSSALVPLVVQEEKTSVVRAILKEDPEIVTWGLSLVEVAGAIERRHRQVLLDENQRREALKRFEDLARAWDEVTELPVVRQRALALLSRQNLRAADALQLAAAYVVAESDPSTLEFVCLDENLSRAAEREGFSVVVW